MQSGTILAGLALAAAGVATLLSTVDPVGDQPPEEIPAAHAVDPIVEQFERELNREPGPARPVERSAIDEDELYQVVNSVHWTGEDES